MTPIVTARIFLLLLPLWPTKCFTFVSTEYAEQCEYKKQYVRNGFNQNRGMDLERDAYEFEDRAKIILSHYFNGWKGLFGAHSFSVGQYCKPNRQHAYLTSLDGRLLVINECGDESPAEFLSDGRLKASKWNVYARSSAGTRQIIWDNGSIWEKPKWNGIHGEYYIVAGQYCSGKNQLPKIEQSGNGLLLTNECGQTSKAIMRDDGSIEATDWNVIGNPEPHQAAIFWANGSVWSK